MQKTYEINVGQDSIDVEFLGANRRFDWLEMSLVHDRTENNREMLAQEIKSLKLNNFTDVYSLTNEKKYDVDNLTQRHLLWKQFVAWNCNGSSIATLVDYINNPIFQELSHEDPYYSVYSGEIMYLDLRATSGYIKEAEKLERNDSKINLHITLKKQLLKSLD